MIVCVRRSGIKVFLRFAETSLDDQIFVCFNFVRQKYSPMQSSCVFMSDHRVSSLALCGDPDSERYILVHANDKAEKVRAAVSKYPQYATEKRQRCAKDEECRGKFYHPFDVEVSLCVQLKHTPLTMTRREGTSTPKGRERRGVLGL